MLILRGILGRYELTVPEYGQLLKRLKTMEKKESYVVFNGVRYDPVKQGDDNSGSCDGCCFYTGDGECSMPSIDGFPVSCDAMFVFAKHPEVAAEQRLTERSEEETDKADKVKREGSIGKRSYYAFPNGVEAEDICRYLSFNLGNVVKYACRAGRKDAKKKIEDLMKARDYLDNEIKRLEEGEE